MDSNRRHQLSQNMLANWIFRLYDEWIRPYGQWIVLGILFILVVMTIFLVTHRLQAHNRQESWSQYAQAIMSDDQATQLTLVVATLREPLATQALLTLAQIQLSEGCAAIRTDKKVAEESLHKAMGYFQDVEKRATNDELSWQALFGQAQVWESLAAVREGTIDLPEAEKVYAKLAEQAADSFWGKKAKEKLSFLKRSDTQQFLTLSAKHVFVVPSDEPMVQFDPENPGLDSTREAFDEPETKPADASTIEPVVVAPSDLPKEPTETQKPE